MNDTTSELRQQVSRILLDKTKTAGIAQLDTIVDEIMVLMNTARKDENEQELTFNMDVTNSMYVKGFNDAVDQIIAYRDRRIAALDGVIEPLPGVAGEEK
jgi:hypothetical protein